MQDLTRNRSSLRFCDFAQFSLNRLWQPNR